MNLTTRIVILIPCWIFFVNPSFAQTPPPDFLLDLNHDGAIDSKDLLILIRKWGLEGIATPTPTITRTFTSTPMPTRTVIPLPTETLTSTSTHTPTFTETSAPPPTDTPTETFTLAPTETPTTAPLISVGLPASDIRMVLIRAGSFMMGSPQTERNRGASEEPIHEVTIDHDFYIGETEVTQLQWQVVMGYNASTHSSDGTPFEGDNGVGNNYPVYFVSWNDCQAFIAALNSLGNGTFRLPSEAEWEYACRAGSTTRFYFGDSLSCDDGCVNCDAPKTIFVESRADSMWFCGSGVDTSRPVRQLFPNAFGLYDMSGNISEWVQDTSHPSYDGAPTDGSAWEEDGSSSRIYRGGDWVAHASQCRSAARKAIPPSVIGLNIGFRLARYP